MKNTVRASILFLSLLLLHTHVEAVTIGQMQTFDDPNHNWVVGAGPVLGTPTLVPTALGGPAGPADPYLSIISRGGSGPGSRLSAQNFVDWAGDYGSAGITHIRMDVRNFGNTDVFLRLLFVDFDASNAPVNAALTTTPVILPGNSDWQTVEFAVTPAALTPGIGTAAGALSDTDELRIFHNPDAAFPVGNLPAIAASIGVDNIRAAAIPEPASWSLLIGGLLAGYVARRRC